MRVIAAVPLVLAALNTAQAGHVPLAGSLDHHQAIKRADISVASTDLELEKRTLGLLCGLPIVSSILCGGGSSKYPSKSWNCNGGGGDGWDYDYNGKTRPSTYPSGWKWFGVNYGWGPPRGWGCADNWSPPSGISWSRFSWWAPQLTWRVPSGFSFPSLWFNFGWRQGSNGHYGYPTSSWSCNGNGDDGWDYDHNGNGRPSYLPSGWLWFGSSIGWGPHRGWSVPSKGWSIPSGISLPLFRWWVPSYGSWNCPSGFQIPSWWYNNGWPTVTVTVTTPAPTTAAPTPTATSCRTRDWQTSGNGKDGCAVDYNGSGKPSNLPDGWLYWGSDIGGNGWGPLASWTPPSVSWPIPDGIDFGRFFWWSAPSWWTPGVETPEPEEPESDCHVPDWQTNGKGTDGCDTDYNGSHVPSQWPSEWLYWGSDFTYNNGWGPAKGWVPPSGWEAPCSMTEYTWWSWPKKMMRRMLR